MQQLLQDENDTKTNVAAACKVEPPHIDCDKLVVKVTIIKPEMKREGGEREREREMWLAISLGIVTVGSRRIRARGAPPSTSLANSGTLERERASERASKRACGYVPGSREQRGQREREREFV